MIPPLLYLPIWSHSYTKTRGLSTTHHDPPPDVEMMDNTATILYLSSSMILMHWNSLDVSYCDSVEPSSMKTSASASVDLPSTSHMSPNLEDAYVNLISHQDASGSSSSSHGMSSLSPPLNYSLSH